MIDNLNAWKRAYAPLRTCYPFNQLFELVENISADESVSLEEQLMLMDRLNRLIDPLKVRTSDQIMKHPINLLGKTCCITGTCVRGTRSEMEGKLAAMGAIVAKSLTKKTDVLIVGGFGHTQWAYGQYGLKIKKALELQEKGIEIKIVGELEIF